MRETAEPVGRCQRVTGRYSEPHGPAAGSSKTQGPPEAAALDGQPTSHAPTRRAVTIRSETAAHHSHAPTPRSYYTCGQHIFFSLPRPTPRVACMRSIWPAHPVRVAPRRSTASEPTSAALTGSSLIWLGHGGDTTTAPSRPTRTSNTPLSR